MKRFLLALLLIASVGAHARDHQEVVALVSPSKVLEVDEPPQPAPPKTVDVRAITVNRCPDASGRLKLQDTPCAPVASTSAAAASSPATDVVDLSALPPRPLKESAPMREPEAKSLMDIALSLGWKLALFVAAGYAIFRAIRAWRDSYALSAALAERQRTR